MSAMVFVGVRVLHVVMAAIWFGSTVFVSTLLTPVVEASGPSGGQVMMGISKRGINAYMGVLGGTTVLTGVFLLWRFLGGFGAIGSSHAALAFTIGGIAGILAGVIGGSIVGRSANRAAALLGQAAGMSDGPAKAALLQLVSPLRQRVKLGSRAVIALQMIALILMTIGHYV